jgi:hypothetical protein
MTTFTIHPENKDQSKVLKAFLKSLGFKFEIDTKSKYSSDFVEMIEKGEKEFKEGKTTSVKRKDLKKFLGE